MRGWPLAAAFAVCVSAFAQNVKTGPEIGQRIPDFRLTDQSGRAQNFASLKGPNGLMLAFVRSADWCPFCKAQLVELQEKLGDYQSRGVNVAVITYDSPAVLKHFAQRMHITYPLLADEGSKVIRAFGIFNDSIESDNPFYGIPYPGNYILDAAGKVKAKYFETDYKQRFTAGSILIREIDPNAAGASQEVKGRQLTLRTSASNHEVYPGSRITLIVEAELPPAMHVYAPGVQTPYLPIDWKPTESKAVASLPATYPKSKMLRLDAIDETVPVYEGMFRVTRDLVIAQEKELAGALTANRELTIDGTFKYQACDDRVCYAPQTLPLKWTFKVGKLDNQRVPAEIRGKVGG